MLVQEKYDIPISNYTFTKINNYEFTRFFNCCAKIEAAYMEDTGRIILIYENDPSHKSQFPLMRDAKDSNNGIDP